MSEKKKFIVKYPVGNEIREKIIHSTMDDCDKDASKVSKKWLDVILVRKIKGW